jgi:hypothetical protein
MTALLLTKIERERTYKYPAFIQHYIQSRTHQQLIHSSVNSSQTTLQLLSKPTGQHTTMQFTTFAFAAFAALTSAAAIEKRSPLEQRAPINLCPAIDTPQCCQLDVDGVAAVTCSARKPRDPGRALSLKTTQLTETSQPSPTSQPSRTLSTLAPPRASAPCAAPSLWYAYLAFQRHNCQHLLTHYRLVLASSAPLLRWRFVWNAT